MKKPSSALLKIINPATGGLVETVRADTPATVKAKFTAACAAQPSWARVPVKEKIVMLARFRESLVAEAELLAATLTSEVGKPIQQSRNELKGVLGRIDFFLEQAPRVLRPETVFEEKNPDGTSLGERITHEPLGVIANISAWNYPYLVGSNVIVPALLAGNAVLYKPSEFATLTGLAIARLMHAAGVPSDIFVPLIGSGEVGGAILRQRIDGVFFTGSYATGKKIARAVAGRMIKLQLELGGKDPIYVCDDVADVTRVAAAVADGAFYNAGQSCCSVERIYVHEKIYDQFVAAFVAEVKTYRMGDPCDAKTYLGPLTRGAQLAVLESQLADAKRKGARVLVGGKRRKGRGNFFEATVVVDVDHTMTMMRDESFGPIIGLMSVPNDAEALRLMNDTEYGLTAGVYAASRGRAEKILRQVKSGSAYWNCCDRVSPRLPWSGLGYSGVGLTLSRAGIATFTRPKAWHLKAPAL